MKNIKINLITNNKILPTNFKYIKSSIGSKTDNEQMQIICELGPLKEDKIEENIQSIQIVKPNSKKYILIEGNGNLYNKNSDYIEYEFTKKYEETE